MPNVGTPVGATEGGLVIPALVGEEVVGYFDGVDDGALVGALVDG